MLVEHQYSVPVVVAVVVRILAEMAAMLMYILPRAEAVGLAEL
jgi:hypothetical protein